MLDRLAVSDRCCLNAASVFLLGAITDSISFFGRGRKDPEMRGFFFLERLSESFHLISFGPYLPSIIAIKSYFAPFLAILLHPSI